MSILDFRGHQLWYEQTGSGPPMLLLHNGGNDHRIWDRQVAHFADRHRVVVVDHLGYGQSDKPAIEYDLPLYREQVATLVEQLQLAPVHLVGLCMGGAMSLAYTLSQPQQVATLTLLNVATEETLSTGPLALAYRTFSASREQLAAFVGRIETEGMSAEETAESIRIQFARGGACPSAEFAQYLHELYNRPGQMRSLYTLLANWKSFAAVDHFTKPPGFPPSMLFWGAENQILPEPEGLRFAERLAPDRFERLEGCGHLAMMEQPRRVNAAIDDFLAHAAPTN